MKKSTQDKVYHVIVAFSIHFLLLFTIALQFRVFNFVTPEVAPKPEIIQLGDQKIIPPALSNESMSEAITDNEDNNTIESPPIDDQDYTPDIPLPKADVEIPEEDSDLPPSPDITKNNNGNPAEGSERFAPRPHGGMPKGGFPKGMVGPPEKKDPSFYGEAIHGKCLFVLDVSGSMDQMMNGGSKRIDNLRAQIIGAIKGFDEDDEFDCIVFSDIILASIWGSLVKATEENKETAITWINRVTAKPIGGTPTGEALELACSYQADLEYFFLVSDGLPTPENEALSTVLNFPTWWNFTNCQFIAVCVGDDGVIFMERMAKAIKNGKYVHSE